jgi:hypothetical protein
MILLSLQIDACAARDTFVIRTLSSVYELIVLDGDQGDVSLRGGRYSPEFQRVLFLGSITDDGSFEPRTIGVGRRMKFFAGDRFIVTSAIQSLSRHPTSVAPVSC